MQRCIAIAHLSSLDFVRLSVTCWYNCGPLNESSHSSIILAFGAWYDSPQARASYPYLMKKFIRHEASGITLSTYNCSTPHDIAFLVWLLSLNCSIILYRVGYTVSWFGDHPDPASRWAPVLVIIWSDGSYRYPSAALGASFVGCRQSDPDDDMPDWNY